MCVRIADARIFTQSFYRKYFLKDRKERTLINPATWIDKDIISTQKSVRSRFEKQSDNTLKIIFPSRLVEDKGVMVLLDALEILKNTNKKIHLTIMGEGELEQQCRQFVNDYNGNVDVVVKDPVTYGSEFFKILASYHFVLVPTLKQEQPRIIFDAFSQGVAVIGSDTSGVMDITNKDNTLTFMRGDSSSLAKTINSITEDKATILEMGLAGLKYATGKTHAQMHKDREKFLEEIL